MVKPMKKCYEPAAFIAEELLDGVGVNVVFTFAQFLSFKVVGSCFLSWEESIIVWTLSNELVVLFL